MTEHDLIKEASRATESECSCSKCANMCKIAPCLGTPQDIVTLINHGHVDKLSLTLWMAGMRYGVAPIEMVQVTQNPDGRCVFLNDKDLCELHESGLKPIEGKLANHSPEYNLNLKREPAVYVALCWLKPGNEKLARFAEKAVIRYKKSNAVTS